MTGVFGPESGGNVDSGAGVGRSLRLGAGRVGSFIWPGSVRGILGKSGAVTGVNVLSRLVFANCFVNCTKANPSTLTPQQPKSSNPATTKNAVFVCLRTGSRSFSSFENDFGIFVGREAGSVLAAGGGSFGVAET